jgi:hypothetical protein
VIDEERAPDDPASIFKGDGVAVLPVRLSQSNGLRLLEVALVRSW